MADVGPGARTGDRATDETSTAAEVGEPVPAVPPTVPASLTEFLS